MPEPVLMRQPRAAAPQSSLRRLLVRTVLATAVVSAVAGGSVRLAGGGGFALVAHGDLVTDPQSRAQQFDKITLLPISPVAPQEVTAALSEMKLTPAAQVQLAQALGAGRREAAPAGPLASEPPTNTGTASASQPVDAARVPPEALEPSLKRPLDPAPKSLLKGAAPKSSPEVRPTQVPAHAASAPPLMLVRISLWDTDAEDHDEVRVESQGYSRTVRLTKVEQSLVVPVGPGGVINVVGARDGEGGGITVGLASGSARAIFPVMSEGQVLGLKVGIP